jgi:DNA-binding winged helix-turn-helix (wHTH) protein
VRSSVSALLRLLLGGDPLAATYNYLAAPCPSRNEPLRFGTCEINGVTGELRRNGSLVRLQPQPFRALLLLVRNPGEIVDRDRLRQEIWGGTTVDFDRSLNVCIALIRSALAENPENPRFVQTVPRRGYRFLATVEPVRSAVRAGAAESETLPAPRAPRHAPQWILPCRADSILILFAKTNIEPPVGQRKLIVGDAARKSSETSSGGAPLPIVEIQRLPVEPQNIDLPVTPPKSTPSESVSLRQFAGCWRSSSIRMSPGGSISRIHL